MHKYPVFLAAILSLLLLSACSSSPDTGGGDGGTTLSFAVNMADEGLEAHVVVQAADGSVIEHKKVGASGEVRFNNVPADALVTALARGIGDVAVEEGIYTLYEASTYPASHVADRSFFFGFYSSFEGFISGVCPEGSTETTIIRIAFSADIDFDAFCFLEDGVYRFADNIVLSDDDLQSDGTVSLVLFAVSDEVDEPTHYAALLDQTPEELFTGIIVEVDSWRDDFGTNKITVKAPDLTDTQSLAAYQFSNRLRKGRFLGLQLNSFSGYADEGAKTASATFKYAPVPGGPVRGWLGAYSYEFKEDGRQSRSTISWNTGISLPVNKTVTVGKELWPFIEELEWSGGSAKLSYSFDGSGAVMAYAAIESWDIDKNIHRYWNIYLPKGIGISGSIAYPQLPADLQAYLPQQDADEAEAFVQLSDHEILGEPLSDSGKEVDSFRNYFDSSVSSLSHRPQPAPGMKESRSLITLR